MYIEVIPDGQFTFVRLNVRPLLKAALIAAKRVKLLFVPSANMSLLVSKALKSFASKTTENQ